MNVVVKLIKDVRKKANDDNLEFKSFLVKRNHVTQRKCSYMPEEFE